MITVKQINELIKKTVIPALFLSLMIPGAIFSENKKIKVLTSVTDLAYFAQRIGGDRVQAESLVRGDQDPHFITARPDFILKASKADIFCQVGLDLEAGWLPVLFRQSRNPKILPGRPGFCDASAGVRILEKPEFKTDRSMGDIHLYGNPHYLTDPVNAAAAASNIRDALVRADPGSKEYYNSNYNILKEDLERLVQTETENMKAWQGVKIAVYHNEFLYFFERFGIQTGLIIEEKAGVPPSASRIRDAASIIKSENIKIIAIAPWSSPDYARALSRQTGAKVIVLPAASGSEKNIRTYEDSVKAMLRRIRDAADRN